MYIYAAVALAAAIAAGSAAWQVQAWRFDSERLEAAEKAREIEKMRRQAANNASAKHETERTKTRTEFVTITERVRDEIEVEKLVYRNVCITDGGLRELANAARATGHTGEPVGTLPADPPAK